MRLFRQIYLIIDEKHLLARFWQSASQFWRTEKAWVAVLTIFLVTVVLLQLLLQILLNVWNRNFFDSLARKDAHALWILAQLFVPLAGASILLAAASVWGRMTAQRNWREALTRQVIEKWLDKERFRHLNHLSKGSENPEYRIAVDIRIATDAPIDLVLAFFSSLLTAFAFFSVLWVVGGSIDIAVFGMTVTIPGYLVLGVIVYSGAMSALMVFFGHHLTSVIERMNQTEAEFRAAADAFREGAGHEEPKTSDGDKTNTLWLRLQAVLLWWREFCWQLVRTTLVSHGNFLFAPVVAWLLCVPKYLSGAMSLGELTQAAAAFVTVQGAFNWLVDNYQRLADWRSSARRVATLLLALDELEAKESAESPSVPVARTSDGLDRRLVAKAECIRRLAKRRALVDQRRCARRGTKAKSVDKFFAFAQAENHGAEETVAGADSADRLDRQRQRAKCLSPGYEKRAEMAKRQRDDFNFSSVNVVARRGGPVLLAEKFHAGKVAHLTQVRLHHVNAVLERGGERYTGGVDDKFGPKLVRDFGRPRIEIIRHAGWQTAAADDEFAAAAR